MSKPKAHKFNAIPLLCPHKHKIKLYFINKIRKINKDFEEQSKDKNKY